MIQSMNKEPNETLTEYCYRLYAQKDDYGWSLRDICDIVYDNTGVSLSKDALRHRIKRYRNKTQDYVDKEYTLSELKTERCKLADERTQVNAIYRRMAREDSIKEIAADFARTMSDKKLLDYSTKIQHSTNKGKSAILCISDVHYGLEVNSSFNQYNMDIAKKRICKLRNKVIEYINKEKTLTLHKVGPCPSLNGKAIAELRSIRSQSRLTHSRSLLLHGK